MFEAKKWYVDQRIRKTLDSLEKNGFQTFFASTGRDALNKVLDLIPSDAKVGIGGSVTVRQIGLVDALVKRGNPVAHHWKRFTSEEERLSTLRQELNSDVFVASSNAVTEDGKLINADGTGNRVAAMIFGPQKVILVVGMNKIVKDVAEGIRRIRDVAAPMNAKRLGRKTPCSLSGECNEDECNTSERVCHVTIIVERRPSKTDVAVILVGEELGY